MARLHALGLALIAAAAPSASAQEAGPQAADTVASAPPVAPAVQDVSLPIGGIRARILLRRGAAIEGLLPLGATCWEKSSPGLDYEEADPSDPAAGLRLYFVLGMEGAIFLRKADIAEVKDLGVISDEAAAALRQGLLDARRKALEEKEARLRESLRRILGTDRVEEAMPAGAAPVPAAPEPAPAEGGPAVAPDAPTGAAPAPAPVAAPVPASGPLTKEDADRARAEARRVRGQELLSKYPPPDWTTERLDTILWRERIAKIPPDDVEEIFVRENDVWLEAVRRKQEAEKKAALPAPPEGAGRPAPR